MLSEIVEDVRLCAVKLANSTSTSSGYWLLVIVVIGGDWRTGHCFVFEGLMSKERCEQVVLFWYGKYI